MKFGGVKTMIFINSAMMTIAMQKKSKDKTKPYEQMPCNRYKAIALYLV